MNFKPERTPWHNFPEVLIQASESVVRSHADYAAGKAGDINAAKRLATYFLSEDAMRTLATKARHKPMVVAVQALEEAGVNVIPTALGGLIAVKLGLELDDRIVQINRVARTGSSGFYRLAVQPLFDGAVNKEQSYLLVDDFVGQGGTLTNLKGHIETYGGRAIVATTLTGKPYSAKLALSDETLHALKSKHGEELEQWWKKEFGYGFDRLTESEARYLVNSPDADTIRNRMVETKQARKQ